MPGLPRKSTKKQFTKLMGKKGKKDWSNVKTQNIATYEQFLKLDEGKKNDKKDDKGQDIVDLLSGQVFSISISSFNKLVKSNLIKWDDEYKCFTFDHKNADKIITTLSDDKGFLQKFLDFFKK